jgi:hypothetical protein
MALSLDTVFGPDPAANPAPAPDLSLFGLLFPATKREIDAVTAAVAPQAAPEAAAPPVSAPAPVSPVPTPTVTPGAAGGRVSLVLAQDPAPSGLAAAYLAATAEGLVQRVNQALPVVVPAWGQATLQIQVPSTTQVLLPLSPLVVFARTHTALLTATVTIDGYTQLENYPLAVDAVVLVQEDVVVYRSIVVQLTNADSVDLGAVLYLNAVAWDQTDYQLNILGLARQVQSRLQRLATGGATP